MLPLYRGRNNAQEGNNYYSPDREWARQFTQSGRDSEIQRRYIAEDRILRLDPLPKAYGTDDDELDRAIAAARADGFAAVWVDEGTGEPESVFVFDRGALRLMASSGEVPPPTRRDLQDACEYLVGSIDALPFRSLTPDDLIEMARERVAPSALPADLSSWAEWSPGELAAMDPVERYEELDRFRNYDTGTEGDWAERAEEWIERGDVPTVVVIEAPDPEAPGGVFQDLCDGRGRVSLAIGMGWATVPVSFCRLSDEASARFGLRKEAQRHTADLPDAIAALEMFKAQITLSDADKGRELIYGDPERFLRWCRTRRVPLPKDAQQRLDQYDASFVEDQVAQRYAEEETALYLRHDPVEAPSFMYYEFRGDFPGGWLLHQSDDPWAIAFHGFKYGAADWDRMGLTTNRTTEYRQREAGLNFAFLVGYGDEGKYGSGAVMFQVPRGVEVYHYGDGEKQVVFVGAEATNFVVLSDDDDGWCAYLPNETRIASDFQSLGEVATHVERHFAEIAAAPGAHEVTADASHGVVDQLLRLAAEEFAHSTSTVPPAGWSDPLRPQDRFKDGYRYEPGSTPRWNDPFYPTYPGEVEKLIAWLRSDETYFRKIQGIASAVENGVVRAYRAVQVAMSPQRVLRGVGQHWTTEPILARPYMALDRVIEGDASVVLVADIPIESIDWEETLRRGKWDAEREVDVLRKAPLMLLGWWDLEPRETTEQTFGSERTGTWVESPMQVVAEASPPLTLYHGTSLETWRSIVTDGVLEGPVYLTDSFEVADRFAEYATENDRVSLSRLKMILAVTLPEPSKLRADLAMYANPEDGVVELDDDVVPPSEEDWQTSLRQVSCVAYEGDITLDHVAVAPEWIEVLDRERIPFPMPDGSVHQPPAKTTPRRRAARDPSDMQRLLDRLWDLAKSRGTRGIKWDVLQTAVTHGDEDAAQFMEQRIQEIESSDPDPAPVADDPEDAEDHYDDGQEERPDVDVFVLPAGTTLYHGTRAPERFTVPDGPAWFSESRAVAEHFIEWQKFVGRMRPRIGTYRTTRELRLVTLTEGMDEFWESIGCTRGSTSEMAEAVCSAGYDGWRANNYPNGGDDTMLCDTSSLEFLGWKSVREPRRFAQVQQRPALLLNDGSIVVGELGQMHVLIVQDNDLEWEQIRDTGFIDDAGKFRRGTAGPNGWGAYARRSLIASVTFQPDLQEHADPVGIDDFGRDLLFRAVRAVPTMKSAIDWRLSGVDWSSSNHDDATGTFNVYPEAGREAFFPQVIAAVEREFDRARAEGWVLESRMETSGSTGGPVCRIVVTSNPTTERERAPSMNLANGSAKTLFNLLEIPSSALSVSLPDIARAIVRARSLTGRIEEHEQPPAEGGGVEHARWFEQGMSHERLVRYLDRLDEMVAWARAHGAHAIAWDDVPGEPVFDLDAAVESASTIELFHGTRLEYLDQIQARGLLYPFLTDDRDAALRWARSYSNTGDDVVLLSVEVDPDRLVPDTNDAQDMWPEIFGDREWEDVRGMLLPEGEEMLRLVHQNRVDWSESIGHDTGSLSVIYIGTVPPSAIQVLYRDGGEAEPDGDDDLDIEASVPRVAGRVFDVPVRMLAMLPEDENPIYPDTVGMYRDEPTDRPVEIQSVGIVEDGDDVRFVDGHTPVAGETYLLLFDGHHRALAAFQDGRSTVPAQRIDVLTSDEVARYGNPWSKPVETDDDYAWLKTSTMEYGHTIWIRPDGSVVDIPTGGPTHYSWVAQNWNTLFPGEPFDDHVVFDLPIERGWVRVRNHYGTLDVDCTRQAMTPAVRRRLLDIVDDRMLDERNSRFSIFLDFVPAERGSRNNRRSRDDAHGYRIPEQYEDFRDAMASGGIGATALRAPSRPLYHGTQSSFEEFDPNLAGQDELYGPGFYFTENPSVAAGYAKSDRIDSLSRKREELANELREVRTTIERMRGAGDGAFPPDQIASFERWEQSNIRDIADLDRAMADAPEKPQVRVARLAIQNAFDAENQGDADVVARALGVSLLPIDQELPDEYVLGDGYMRLLEACRRAGVLQTKAELRQRLESLGYDGITHEGGKLTGGDSHRVWIAFRPDQIQHGFGDRTAASRPPEGFFDPRGEWMTVTREGGHARFARRVLSRQYKGWGWETDPDLDLSRLAGSVNQPVFALLSRGWMRISNNPGYTDVNVDVWEWNPRMKGFLEFYLLSNRIPDRARLFIDEQKSRRSTGQTVASFYEDGPGWYAGERQVGSLDIGAAQFEPPPAMDTFAQEFAVSHWAAQLVVLAQERIQMLEDTVALWRGRVDVAPRVVDAQVSQYETSIRNAQQIVEEATRYAGDVLQRRVQNEIHEVRLDLTGWRYVDDPVAAAKAIQESSQFRMILIEVRTADTSSFDPRGWHIKIKGPDEWNILDHEGVESSLARVRDHAHHEITHAAQMLLKIVKGLRAPGGLPRKIRKSMDPEAPDVVGHGPGSRDVPHEMLDVEFHTDLEGAARSLARALVQSKRTSPGDLDRQITLFEMGEEFRSYRSLLPSPFYTWKTQDPERWRKAVKIFGPRVKQLVSELQAGQGVRAAMRRVHAWIGPDGSEKPLQGDVIHAEEAAWILAELNGTDGSEIPSKPFEHGVNVDWRAVQSHDRYMQRALYDLLDRSWIRATSRPGDELLVMVSAARFNEAMRDQVGDIATSSGAKSIWLNLAGRGEAWFQTADYLNASAEEILRAASRSLRASVEGVTQWSELLRRAFEGEEQGELDFGRWPVNLVRAIQSIGYESPSEVSIRRVVSSTDPEDRSTFGNAAWQEGGELVGYHVTDDAAGLVAFLEGGGDVLSGRARDKFGDLGAGLYVSATPQLWTGRATGKWDFLENLDDAQRHSLADAIRATSQLRDTGYVNADERERALRDLARFESGEPSYIVYLAGQPYNIAFWKRDFLEPLGIPVGRGPEAVEVRFTGRFVELDGGLVDYGLPDALRAAGYQGMFTRGGFSTIPQLVIWDTSAIRSVRNAGLDLGAAMAAVAAADEVRGCDPATVPTFDLPTGTVLYHGSPEPELMTPAAPLYLTPNLDSANDFGWGKSSSDTWFVHEFRTTRPITFALVNTPAARANMLRCTTPGAGAGPQDRGDSAVCLSGFWGGWSIGGPAIGEIFELMACDVDALEWVRSISNQEVRETIREQRQKVAATKDIGWLDGGGSFYPVKKTHRDDAVLLARTHLGQDLDVNEAWVILLESQWTRVGYSGAQHLFTVHEFGRTQRAAIEAYLTSITAPQTDVVVIEDWSDPNEYPEWRGSVSDFYGGDITLRAAGEGSGDADLDATLVQLGFAGIDDARAVFTKDFNSIIVGGVQCYAGVFSLVDFTVEETVTFSQAMASNHHHAWYLSPGAVERIDDGDSILFVGGKDGRLIFPHGEGDRAAMRKLSALVKPAATDPRVKRAPGWVRDVMFEDLETEISTVERDAMAVSAVTPGDQPREPFSDYIARIKGERQAAYNEFVAAFRPHLEFRSAKDTVLGWAFVVREPYESDREWRVQQFDDLGFRGHMARATVEEARDELFGLLWRGRDDRVVPDAGALSRLTGTPKWNEGMEWSRKVQRENEEGWRRSQERLHDPVVSKEPVRAAMAAKWILEAAA